jgi:hypothetical protein
MVTNFAAYNRRNTKYANFSKREFNYVHTLKLLSQKSKTTDAELLC